MAAMYARLAVRISPPDVGRRVTVRARHHGPEAAVADVVGVLRSWRGGVLTIERRDGTTRSIAEADLVAARVVPPNAVRHRGRGSDPSSDATP